MTDSHSLIVSELFKDSEILLSQQTWEKMGVIHAMVGLSSEIGELTSALTGVRPDLINAEEELGDIEFYIEALCQASPLVNPWRNPDREVGAVWRSAWPFTGICSKLNIETGKLMDVTKKWFIYNEDLNVDLAQSALLRVTHWLEATYQRCQISRDEAIRQNIIKLKVRYHAGYSDTAAKERADKQEHSNV